MGKKSHCGPPLSALVAVCSEGSAFRSTDGGVTWQAARIDSGGGAFESWEDVAWTGTRLVAVGGGGLVATSSNGTTWTVGVSGTTANLYRVAWSGQGLVAVGDGGAAIGSLVSAIVSPSPTTIPIALSNLMDAVSAVRS